MPENFRYIGLGVLFALLLLMLLFLAWERLARRYELGFGVAALAMAVVFSAMDPLAGVPMVLMMGAVAFPVWKPDG